MRRRLTQTRCTLTICKGDENVRLVDADKQLEWVDYMKPIHGIGLEPVVAVETVRDLVKGFPTIDAIPVEWLEEHDGVDIRDSDGNIYARRRITVVEALSMWQKEQEAQDG